MPRYCQVDVNLIIYWPIEHWFLNNKIVIEKFVMDPAMKLLEVTAAAQLAKDKVDILQKISFFFDFK